MHICSRYSFASNDILSVQEKKKRVPFDVLALKIHVDCDESTEAKILVPDWGI
jgi:hypothetical protein